MRDAVAKWLEWLECGLNARDAVARWLECEGRSTYVVRM